VGDADGKRKQDRNCSRRKNSIGRPRARLSSERWASRVSYVGIDAAKLKLLRFASSRA